jgi:hypothetical protein
VKSVKAWSQNSNFNSPTPERHDMSNCPECENTLVSTANPLPRIFGNVRAFECAQCHYMMLEYAVEPIASAQRVKRLPPELEDREENDPGAGARTGAAIHRM